MFIKWSNQACYLAHSNRLERGREEEREKKSFFLPQKCLSIVIHSYPLKCNDSLKFLSMAFKALTTQIKISWTITNSIKEVATRALGV